MHSDSGSSIDSNSDCGSSGNEGDSEGEEILMQNDMGKVVDKLKDFHPYMYEPKKLVSSTSPSDSESSISEGSSFHIDSSVNRIGKTDWCKCKRCKKETREIDCLCCQEVAALNLKFDFCEMECITDSDEFATLCLNKAVLANVLTGLHVSRGDYLENVSTNRSLRYASYKQYVWWTFKTLGKGNRRVIPSCVIWKIRNTFPEPDEQYTLYSVGHKD